MVVTAAQLPAAVPTATPVVLCRITPVWSEQNDRVPVFTLEGVAFDWSAGSHPPPAYSQPPQTCIRSSLPPIAPDRDQTCRRRRSRAPHRSAKIRQCRPITHAPLRKIGYLRRVDRPQRTHRRSLVGRHPGPQQVRNGNPRNNQNNRHHDQQLDQRKAFLPLCHSDPLNSIW